MRLRIVIEASLHHPDELEEYLAWHEMDVQDLDENRDLERIAAASLFGR